MRTQTSEKNMKKTPAKTILKTAATASTKAAKTTVPDYVVCEAAMKNPKIFADLARWGREEINIAEKEHLELIKDTK